jgi:hypothetical protein
MPNCRLGSPAIQSVRNSSGVHQSGESPSGPGRVRTTVQTGFRPETHACRREKPLKWFRMQGGHAPAWTRADCLGETMAAMGQVSSFVYRLDGESVRVSGARMYTNVTGGELGSFVAG